MQSSWAIHQKLQYTIGFTLVFFLLAGYPLYAVVNAVFFKTPTCFDQKQNQDERGVDCGGICPRPCVGETQDLSIVWSRTLLGANGYYDVAAKIDNPNPDASLKSFNYTVKIYDKDGSVIFQKDGTNYASAGERFLVFEPNIYLGDKTPDRTEFEIVKPLDWVTEEVNTISIQTVGKKELLNTENGSRLNATLQNSNIIGSYSDIDVYAVVSDITGRPVGISQTYVKNLIAGESKDIFFTWTMSLEEQTRGLCANRASLPTDLLVPFDAILVFDRSGSMNDDGANPPQPLTDAKNAAEKFVDEMLFVDRGGLVSFAAEASSPLDQGLTGSQEELRQAINVITIGVPDNQQHTNLGDGIKKALEELKKNGREKAKKAVIALTDGVATRPVDPIHATNEKYAEDYAALQADQTEKEDILLYVIGLGTDINTQFLQFDIASSPEKFYHAKSSDDLANIYKDIAQAVCEEDLFLYEIYIRVPSETVK